jgi:hypothetical protein
MGYVHEKTFARDTLKNKKKTEHTASTDKEESYGIAGPLTVGAHIPVCSEKDSHREDTVSIDGS